MCDDIRHEAKRLHEQICSRDLGVNTRYSLKFEVEWGLFGTRREYRIATVVNKPRRICLVELGRDATEAVDKVLAALAGQLETKGGA